MVYVKKLLTLKEGDQIVINGISLKVDNVQNEVDVDRSNAPEKINIEEAGKTIFLSDENNEFHLWVSQGASETIFEKIKRDSISHPWEYKILEKVEIKEVEEANK
jgi:hypothetical protein